MNKKILWILTILSGVLAIYGEVSILMRTEGFDALFFELGYLIVGMSGLTMLLWLTNLKER